MQPATMILIYVIVWWVLFFMALPIGIKGSGIDPESGAPKLPHLRKKALWVSAIALGVTALIIGFLVLFGEQFYVWASFRG